jgi:hypothetical protein
MLKAITNWSMLSDVLQPLGLKIYTCEDCGHVWLASSKEMPARCHQRDCRAWANSPKRDSVGRPPSED